MSEIVLEDGELVVKPYGSNGVEIVLDHPRADRITWELPEPRASELIAMIQAKLLEARGAAPVLTVMDALRMENHRLTELVAAADRHIAELKAGLREAWLDIPFDGTVAVGTGRWLQPLVNAVSAIVDPDRTLRETEDAQRRGHIASLRSKYDWAAEQVRLATKASMDATEWELKRDEAADECRKLWGVELVEP